MTYKSRGFTLVETMVVIGIMLVLALLVLPIIGNLQSEVGFDNNAQEVISVLRLARSKTLSSEGAAQWGVYFATSSLPHRYILFKGENYASRDPSFDKAYTLPKKVRFGDLDFQGGKEIVFNRLSGAADLPGSLSVFLVGDASKKSDIYVEKSGRIFLDASVVSDADRLKDSRHIHLNYARDISTSTEKILLTFDGSVQKEIPIADNFVNGQFFWEGEVNVDGSIQKLKIHTHRLNAFDTQFCIHRDRRYNDKSLEIDISGDTAPSPNLIRYEADGATSAGNSIYVSEPIWQ